MRIIFQNTIDPCDFINRHDELLYLAGEENLDLTPDDVGFTDDDELVVLAEILEQIDESQLREGNEIVSEDHFSEYAYSLASMESDCDEWPFNHVDWDAASEELKMDYSNPEVKVKGFEFSFFIRAY